MTHSKDFMCNSALDITGRKVQLSQINHYFLADQDFQGFFQDSLPAIN